MSIVPERVERCTACGDGSLAVVIDLPKLPLSALFSSQMGVAGTRAHDQRFLFCERCGHGMLETQLPPSELYGSEYGFRTAASEFGKQGTDAYMRFLERVAGNRLQDAAVVDVGCNDLLLLEQLAPRARKLLGIDPIWKGREHEVAHPKISVVGDLLEHVDLSAWLGGPPDLVLCRHTLEHIDDPRLFLGKLLDVAGPETLFVFEFPHLDTLVSRHRYDHIFHQHVQYFSKQSFARLLRELGAEIVFWDENPHHWDAFLVAFRKTGNSAAGFAHAFPMLSAEQIQAGYDRFREKMSITALLLAEATSPSAVGFGAAQMLPVILYHLGGTGGIETVYDDDPAKNGLSYVNLPVVIRTPASDTNLKEKTVLITAPDSARPILRRLGEFHPRAVIIPALVF